MNNIFKLKLIVAIGIVLAATFSAEVPTLTRKPTQQSALISCPQMAN